MSCSHQSTARRCRLANSAAPGPYSTTRRRKECQIEEGHLMPDHVHILLSIPKYSVAEVIGYLKGRAPFGSRDVERKPHFRPKFWARGYFVSTVGRDEETIRAYIRSGMAIALDRCS